MDYFDTDHARYAEERRRLRHERQARFGGVRRKRALAVSLVAAALASSFLAASLVRAEVRPTATPEALAVAAVPKAEMVPKAPKPASPGSPRAAVPNAAVVPKSPKPAPVPSEGERVRIAIGPQGYEPDVVRVRAGVPVTLTVERGEGCAAGFLMPDLGISKDNSQGAVTFRIGPLSPGTYSFTCGMGMVGGRLVAR